MIKSQEIGRVNELLSELYKDLSYSEFQVGLEFVNRAFFALCKKDRSFNTTNQFVSEYGCEDDLLRVVIKYYIEGKASLEEVQDYIFPMINALSRCNPNKKADELKDLFLNVYKN